jgi:flagellar motor switch protein FliM
MTNSPVRKISPFPFDELPRLSAVEQAFERKLARAQETLSGSSDLLESLVDPVAKLLKIRVAAKVTALETVSLDNLVMGLPECSLIAQFRLDVRGSRALLVFDTALAQLLINAVLSGGRAVADESGIDVLRPLSPLSEGVLQYVVVSAMERAVPAFVGKEISPAFEDVIREPARLKSLFANGERFLVAVVSLGTTARDYLVRAVLPLSLLDSLAAGSTGGAWSARAEAFGDFKADFQVEAGRVEVTEAELAGLSPGDIVIFDESSVRLESGRLTGGEAVMRPYEGDGESGFLMELAATDEGLSARVKSAV